MYNFLKHVLFSAVLFAGCSVTEPAFAQGGQVIVRERGSDEYTVYAFGPDGSSRQDAGLMAMSRACSIAKDNGYTHIHILGYRTFAETMQRNRRSEMTDYVTNSEGRVMGINNWPGRSRTAPYGSAFVSFSQIDADTANVISEVDQIADAQTCRILN